VNCELVSEYAKDLVWEGSMGVLDDQVHMFGEQYHRLFRVLGKVELVISDSPIILPVLYDKTKSPSLAALGLEKHLELDNINFFVNRIERYDGSGRYQDERGADEMTKKIKTFLNDSGIKYVDINGDRAAVIYTLQYLLAEKEGLFQGK